MKINDELLAAFTTFLDQNTDFDEDGIKKLIVETIRTVVESYEGDAVSPAMVALATYRAFHKLSKRPEYMYTLYTTIAATIVKVAPAILARLVKRPDDDIRAGLVSGLDIEAEITKAIGEEIFEACIGDPDLL